MMAQEVDSVKKNQEEKMRYDNYPRCSTPMQEPCRGPRHAYCLRNGNLVGPMLFPPEIQDNDYIIWKSRLQHPKTTDNMKIRGIGKSKAYANTSMISGHFDKNREIPACFWPVEKRAAPPFYQMFYPCPHPGAYQSSMIYAAPNPCPYQKPMCYSMPVAPGPPMHSIASVPHMQPVAPIPQYQYDSGTGMQFFMQPVQHRIHPLPPPLPQMKHMYYNYPAFMTNPQPNAYYDNGHMGHVTMDNRAWVSFLMGRKI